GLRGPDASCLVAQIESAARRSHGEGAPRSERSGGLAWLARGDDGPRAWLARIDAAALQVDADLGYRGALLEEHDLWPALEDADAPADLRAAAARILVRARGATASTTERVHGALAAVRDGKARACIEAAIHGDFDHAARELDALDALERGS